MPEEISTLRERHRLDRHHLTVDQAVRVEWGMVGFTVGLALMFVGLEVPLVSIVALLLILASAALLLAGYRWPHRTAVTLQGAELVVTGRPGWSPVKRAHRMPLTGLQVSAQQGAVISGHPSWCLSLAPAGRQPVTFRSLTATADEIERVTEVIRAAASHATSRQGAGEAEVPVALSTLQARE